MLIFTFVCVFVLTKIVFEYILYFQVFDDVAVELTMSLLEYFKSNPNEEQLYRCLKALSKFVQISGQEVPQLIQMIGPDPRSFKGQSERVDALVEQISTKLR